ncbi:MAG: exodeoxyribonuclease VII large subunit [bacterium]|nr:exodeoxyribonuclease VII large subunit [bacterium]
MNVEYLTVSALSKYLKFIMDDNPYLNQIYIKGEISNFKAHTRGHYYFTLKDENSRINAVMFSYQASSLKFLPQDGMKVLIRGKVTVYELGGNYQLYVDEMIEDGIGNLYIAYEQLKKKLESEGLFDKKYKKALPKIPKTIGIVTASTGAAIKDILTTIKRRYPICTTILFPSLVQGGGATKDIVSKIELANTYKDIDVLIVGRGGGSIEDLWAFNEEEVARAIFNSRIPIISAVGHEVDFTIADFVADLRAPTPTAAAELAVPDVVSILNLLENMRVRSTNVIKSIIQNNYNILKKIENSYVLKQPMAVYEIKEQRLDNLMDRLNKTIQNICDGYKIKLFNLKNSYVLNNPAMLYKFKQQELTSLITKLEVLNPVNTISRGYAILKQDNKIISSVKGIKKNDIINISLRDGTLISKVVEVKNEKEF